MIRYLYLSVLLLPLLSPRLNAQTFTLDSTTLVADTLLTGLNVPWELLWGPDDYLWMTEREGKVSRIEPQTGAREVILNISQANGGPVNQVSEAGLLGMALHPNFYDSSYVYLVYTYRVGGNIRERMVRYEFDTDTLINPQTLIENIPGNSTHNGSRLLFGPDGKLYMTTGDAQNQPSAQNTASPSGKTLRFNADGSVPSDNPIAGSYVWSWGHRNAQGLLFGPTGLLYSSEHGPNNDDEINIIHPARNYGWPTAMGLCNTPTEIAFCTDSNVVESIFQWTPTIAPADLVYYSHPAIPEWQGKLLLSVLKNKQVVSMALNAAEDSITAVNYHFTNQWGRLRDICIAPDGTIYLATNGASSANTDPNTHSIIRLKNPNYAPPIVIDAGPDLSVCPNGIIEITASATGGRPPLTYSWTPVSQLTCSACLSPTTLPLTNTTPFILTVTDNNGTSVSDTVVVSVVAQPSTPSYTLNILDSNARPVALSFDVTATASDSVVVTITNGCCDTVRHQTYFQSVFTITDSIQANITSSEPADVFIDYTICIQSYSSCGVAQFCDTQRVTIDLVFSANDLKQPTFGLYPNPTTGTVTLLGILATDKIMVMNALGTKIRLLDAPIINGNEYTLNLSSLEPGIYFIGLERTGAMGVQKVILH